VVGGVEADGQFVAGSGDELDGDVMTIIESAHPGFGGGKGLEWRAVSDSRASGSRYCQVLS